MPANRIDMQYVLDRTEIQELHLRYFRGIDRGDREEVRACFTSDAHVAFHGGQPAVGNDAVVNKLLADLFHRAANKIGNVTFHFMGNMNIVRLEGDDAETETYALSSQVRAGESPGGDEARIRGLRYLDRLKRTKEGWKISQRQHTLDWMANAPASAAASIAERLNGLPSK